MKKDWLVKSLALGVVVLFIGTGVVSALNVGLMDNNPPSAPTIDGPISGKVGVPYEFTFCAEDPDGDDVFYFVDWGDGTNTGWFGPFPSGEGVMIQHVWTKKGTYEIKAKAKDVYGLEGPYGLPPVPITITKKDRAVSMSIQNFIQEKQEVVDDEISGSTASSGSLDTTFEVITLIRDVCTSSDIIMIGPVRLYGSGYWGLEITALTINPLKLIHKEHVVHFYAPIFIGISFFQMAEDCYSVNGIAFGNIEWS